MVVQIIDVLGIETGVHISNVRAEYDEKRKRIKIYGKLCKREYYDEKVHSRRIICIMYDGYDKIITSQEGVIFGDFSYRKTAIFKIVVEEFDLIDWNETSKILLEMV